MCFTTNCWTIDIVSKVLHLLLLLHLLVLLLLLAFLRPLAELVPPKSQPCASNYLVAESWRAGTWSRPARPSPRRYHAGVPCLAAVSTPSIELFFSDSSTRWGSAVARAAASPRCRWPSSTWWTCLKVSLSPVSSSFVLLLCSTSI